MTILAEIGQQLQQARLTRKRSIEDLARETHLKPAHIRALEAGDESSLPEPVYVKSFIRKYAQAVGLPGDELAHRYWETRPLPPAPVATKTEFSAPWWILPLVLMILLFAGLVYAYKISTRPMAPSAAPTPQPLVLPSPTISVTPSTRPSARTPQPAKAPAASPSPTHKPSPRPTHKPIPKPTRKPSPKPSPKHVMKAKPSPKPRPLPSPKVSPAPLSTSSIVPGNATHSSLSGLSGRLLKLHAVERTWVAVSRQGHELYSGILQAGQTRVWPVFGSLSVTIGNGAGVQVSYGSQTLGVLGAEGQVVKRVFK